MKRPHPPPFRMVAALACLPLLLAAQIVPPGAATGAEDIRPPKPLVEIPAPPESRLWLWLSLAALLVLLPALAFLFWRRLRRPRAQSPREMALGSLGALAAADEELPAEQFANRAADIVRQFIARRFGLAAPHRTTEEFLRQLAAADSPLAGQREPLRDFLGTCDLAKFAGALLDSDQRTRLIDSARDFVRSSTPPTEP